MQKYLISEEEVESILECLKTRDFLRVRKELTHLEVYKNPVIEELRKFLRNKGRSSILESDIRDIINKFSEEEKDDEM